MKVLVIAIVSALCLSACVGNPPDAEGKKARVGAGVTADRVSGR